MLLFFVGKLSCFVVYYELFGIVEFCFCVCGVGENVCVNERYNFGIGYGEVGQVLLVEYVIVFVRFVEEYWLVFFGFCVCVMWRYVGLF